MSLDIIIPAHDEEKRIERTLTAYRSAFTEHDVRFHVALDGCSDGTADLVRRHVRDDDRVHLHEYPKVGKGGVLLRTFGRCDADLIGFVDADCATPPAELKRMTEAAAGVDGVIASRRLPASVTPRRRGSGRSLTSTGFAWLVRATFDLPYADTQCGAKILRRSLVQRVLPLLSSHDFLFDVDLLVAARHTGFDVVEVPTVWIDQSGSKLNAHRDALRMLVSALRLWNRHRLATAADARRDGSQLPTPEMDDRARAA